ncbi:MAG: hypothetical protein RI910_1008 [Verrucomicrobiota bacterium]|jgi:hypothetical protein
MSTDQQDPAAYNYVRRPWTKGNLAKFPESGNFLSSNA